MQVTETSELSYLRAARHGHPLRRALEIVCVAVFWLGAATMLWMIVHRITGVRHIKDLPGTWRLANDALGLAALIPATLFAAAAMQRPAGQLLSIVGRVRWRWLASCLLLALAIELLGFTTDLGIAAVRDGWAASTSWLHPPAWGSIASRELVLICLIPLQAAGEECFFRGTLLQTFGAWRFPAWLAIAVTSLLFAGTHHGSDLARLSILIDAIIFAWLALRTGGLEASIGLHAANNVLAFTLEAVGRSQTTWFSVDNSQHSWVGFGVHAATALAYAVIVTRLFARRAGRGS